MGVEIPVYVNITQGINDAIRQIPAETKKLQSVLNQNVLNMRFNVEGYPTTLQDILIDETMQADELKSALKSIRREFDAVSKAEANTARTSAKVKNLAKAYGLVEQRLTGIYNKNTASGMMVENTINKVLAKLQTLRTSLATATPNYDKINYQIKIQEERLAKLNTQLRAYRISTTETNEALSRQGGILSQVNGLMSTYVSIFGLFRFAKQVRDVTAELEYQRIALGHLIQDEQYGARLFEQIKAQAVESPFRIKDLVTYTKQLAAYRIEQENLFDTTKRLADVSAGLGVDMNRLILAYGQVRAASVLRGQELRQFTEAGIPLVELPAEKFTELNGQATTTADVFRKISERAVPFSMISEIFEDLTEKGGMFFKMQETQAQTLKGRWEKLKDTFDIALQSIGESETFEKYNNIILRSATLLAQNIRVIPKLIEGLTAAWVSYSIAVALTNKRVKQAISYETAFAASRKAESTKISVLTTKIIGEARAREILTKAYAKQSAGASLLSKAIGKLTVAMLTNPISAVLAGVVALTTIFTTFRKKVDETSNSLEYLDDSVEKIATAEKEFARSERLITRYEKLASKTERTAKENQNLYKTMEQLRDIFPEISLGIDSESGSLENQITLLKRLRKEREEQARNEAMGTYETTKKDLEDALERQKKLEHEYQQAFDSQQRYEADGLKWLEKRWRKVTQEKKEELDALRGKIEKMYSALGSLERYLFPEKANENLAEWQQQVMKIQEEKVKAGANPLFTPDEIEKMTSVYDLFKNTKKESQDLEESIKGMEEAFSKMAAGDAKEALGGEIEEKKKTLEIANAIKELFGFIFSNRTSSSYKKDPFITNMEQRMKFMKDFKNGYDDLRKYMASTRALDEQSKIMLGRGASLGLDTKEQQRAAKDLSQWYHDMIEEVKRRMQAKGAKGVTVNDLLGLQISDANKQLKDLQSLLQSLWDAKTDFDTSQLKKYLEDELKRLSDEIKQSETARNFYKNILDLTGDEQLAAQMSISVYGDIGKDFKDRIQQQLNEALSKVEGDVPDELKDAIAAQDFSTILKYINKFPYEWQKNLKQMASDSQKFNADLIQSWLKELKQVQTYGDKRVEIAKKTAEKIKEIEESNIPETQKKGLIEDYQRKQDREITKVEYEAFKEMPSYIELFANLDAASSTALSSMRESLIAVKSQWKDLAPTDLKEIQSRLEELDEQLAMRNPFKAMIDSIKEYRSLNETTTREEADAQLIAANQRVKIEKDILSEKTQEYQSAVKTYGVYSEQAQTAKINMETQAAITDEAIDQAENAQEVSNGYRRAVKHIMDAGNAMAKWAEYAQSVLNSMSELWETFGSAESAEMFNTLNEGLGKLLSGTAEAGTSIARIMAGDLTAIPQAVEGITKAISGVFGSFYKLKIQNINKKIEKQQELLDGLEYSYNRLDKAMAKAFGSDYIYNYNKQLENLAAQQAAYEKQAELERQKGKKKDKDKIKDYENAATETADQIADMQGQLSEFFAGTDLTSAAQDFADAWIEAYKEFGSTTDAMTDKFNDMIQNMITQSLGAKIMQSILQPLFDEIDAMAESGGELSAQEIANIANVAPEYVAKINEAMSGLMNSLVSAGYNVRQGVGSFTGISRDIAGASEDSINGLAAGINTQNFYMSLISQNVAAILAAITGDTVEGATGASPTVDPYKDQMLTYVSSLPQMRDDMASIRAMLQNVIRPNGTTSTHYVAVRM